MKTPEEEIRHLFLTLWSKAAEAEGYNKKEWQRLRELLSKTSEKLKDL